jgi:DNA polymerase IV
VSHLESHWDMQLELPLDLKDGKPRPGTERGMARWTADRAIDKIRDRFGWEAVGYGSVMLGLSRSVPDEFRQLAEKDLQSARNIWDRPAAGAFQVYNSAAVTFG